MASDPPIRVLVAKIGLDGHDRGVKIVARMLRDAGMEVIYAGLRQTPETVAAIAVQEDVDVIGLSMHNAAHRTLVPLVIEATRNAGLEVPIVVGGIIPEADAAFLLECGVASLLGPGSSADDVKAAVQQAVATGA
jgi:methylmalonyl-CoA mutase, C-terminal domain